MLMAGNAATVWWLAVCHALQQQWLCDATVTDGPGTASAHPLVLSLQGGPGCGKSAVTRHLIDLLVKEHQVNTLVTATTTTAAQRLLVTAADTVHAACQVPVHGSLSPMRQLAVASIALQMAGIVICDEFSMLTAATLNVITSRMSQATPKGHHRKVLLLVGDLGQLPPICRHGSRRLRGVELPDDLPGLCPHCHLLRSDEFKQGRHLRLSKVYRQAEDVQFAEFLNEVRDAAPTAHRLHQILGACFVPASSLWQEMDTTATILCTHNRDVKKHNRTALRWHQKHGDIQGQQVYSVAMQHDALSGGPEGAKKAKAWLNAPHFHQLTHVAVGARVIFNTTVNKAAGSTNSALGTVEKVITADAWPEGMPGDRNQPRVQKLKVRLDTTGKTVTVSRTKVATTHRHGRAYSKRTFPLLLAYAMTAHRCQGATLTGKVILDVRSAFSPAIVYVMLSRATTRANVRVLGELLPQHFVPVCEAGFAAWERQQQQIKQAVLKKQLEQQVQRQQQELLGTQLAVAPQGNPPVPLEDQPVLPDAAGGGGEDDSSDEEEEDNARF